ncbi:type II toxin-antitoxin system RnlB family antitoxin [Bacillus sp. 1P02SD]|uniref:type II toxin-antitoxin system RnlB family antitoxin n=1 Tax=Bacillus sp. 1P02SD TaxID=3132264 RepID=UPI0039A0C867
MKNVVIELLNDSSYFALLTTLSSDSPINTIKNFENENGFECSGRVLVDSILHSGNNSDRFIELFCENGKINYSSFSFVQIERKNELRVKANDTLRKYPQIINNSILNNSQKKLLLHGISI